MEAEFNRCRGSDKRLPRYTLIRDYIVTRTTDLTPLLKRLQLGPMAATLPERIALARREQLDYASFLEIILSAFRSLD